MLVVFEGGVQSRDFESIAQNGKAIGATNDIADGFAMAIVQGLFGIGRVGMVGILWFVGILFGIVWILVWIGGLVWTLKGTFCCIL